MFLACLFFLAFAGCASGGSPAGVEPDRGFILDVDNQGYADQVVYMVGGDDGRRFRIGMATGMSKTRIRVKAGFVSGPGGDIRIATYSIGGGLTAISESASFTPGIAMKLQISPMGGLFFFY